MHVGIFLLVDKYCSLILSRQLTILLTPKDDCNHHAVECSENLKTSTVVGR